MVELTLTDPALSARTDHPAADRHAPRLRVLVVAESFLPQVNGVTNSVCRVLEHLRARGHSAAVIAPTGPQFYAGAAVHRVGGAALPGYAGFTVGLATRRSLRSIMRRFRPDVVHVASPFVLGYAALRAAHALGIPTVSIYQTDVIGFARRYRAHAGRLLEARLRRIHHLSDLTLVPSAASLEQLSNLGIPRLRYWPRGIDTDRFTPARRNESVRAALLASGAAADGVTADGAAVASGAPADVGAPANRVTVDGVTADDARPVGSGGVGSQGGPDGGGSPDGGGAAGPPVLVGYVGRLAKEKDLVHLRVVDRMPGVRLVLVGEGPQQEALRTALPGALFLGVRHGDDLAELVACLDIFVHPGTEETFCQAVQEALASGVPAVGPAAGGLKDRIDHGTNGLHYAPGDLAGLGAAVARLAGDAPLRRQMGRAARAGLAGRSWQSVNDHLIDHYRSVVPAAVPGGPVLRADPADPGASVLPRGPRRGLPGEHGLAR